MARRPNCTMSPTACCPLALRLGRCEEVKDDLVKRADQRFGRAAHVLRLDLFCSGRDQGTLPGANQLFTILRPAFGQRRHRPMPPPIGAGRRRVRKGDVDIGLNGGFQLGWKRRSAVHGLFDSCSKKRRFLQRDGRKAFPCRENRSKTCRWRPSASLTMSRTVAA